MDFQVAQGALWISFPSSLQTALFLIVAYLIWIEWLGAEQRRQAMGVTCISLFLNPLTY